MSSKKEYSSDVFNVFEILATHFTDVYYNVLYDYALNYIATETPDISKTEAYKIITGQYYKSIEKNREKFYIDTINNVKQLFNNYTNFGIFTSADCIEKLVNTFAPKEYVANLDEQEKTKIIYTCISTALGEVTNEIIVNYMPLIIDNRQNHQNAKRIKQMFVEYFSSQREKLFNMFTMQYTKDMAMPVDAGLAKKFKQRAREAEEKYLKLKDKANEVVNEKIKIIERLTKANTLLEAQAKEYSSRLEMISMDKNDNAMTVEKLTRDLEAKTRYTKTLLNQIDDMESEINILRRQRKETHVVQPIATVVNESPITSPIQFETQPVIEEDLLQFDAPDENDEDDYNFEQIIDI